MTCYSDLPYLFLEYFLETSNYILNLVPSKLVPGTSIELWTECKLGLWHVQI